MSSLNIQRILFLVLTLTIILSKVYFLLIYQFVYYLSFEYLNSNSKYAEIKAHKIYNWLFVSYFAFEVLVRTHLFHFTKTTDYNINTIEHLFFTFLISLIISIYMQFFNLLSGNRLLKLIAVFAVLNFIGLINEYFQNFYQSQPIFYLDADDTKDLIINLIGSSLFAFLSLVYSLKKSPDLYSK
jgi:hypothetical protein